MSEVKLYHGNCLAVMAGMDANSIDAVVTDPPAGISFMGKSWDSNKGGRDQWIEWLTEVMEECYRVMKPGAMALVWALPRTSHWTGTALEDAGFAVKDIVTHIFGTGFPKSHDISKAIDKAAGAEGEYGAPKSDAHAGWIERGRMRGANGHDGYQRPWMQDSTAVDRNARQYAPATDLAKTWSGYGTALKPAAEFWWLAMKPIDKNFAHNAEVWGVAGLNVDGCRVDHGGDIANAHSAGSGAGYEAHNNPGRKYGNGLGGIIATPHPTGRWPANLILDESAASLLDEMSGVLKSGSRSGHRNQPKTKNAYGPFTLRDEAPITGDSGGASRYFAHCDYGPDDAEALRMFYCAKASRAERNAGLEGMEETVKHSAYGEYAGTPEHASNNGKPRQNGHPTIKPIKLMEYLCRLVQTPTGGIVLDPFMGSGSTGVACVRNGQSFIGIEELEEYVDIARRRIEHAQQQLQLPLEGIE